MKIIDFPIKALEYIEEHIGEETPDCLVICSDCSVWWGKYYEEVFEKK